MPSISAVLVCRNERQLLDLALRSVTGWVDEVIVGNMASTDGSAELARSLGATVVDVPPAPTSEYVRQSLIEKASGDWLLLLDPDEVIEPPLARRLAAVIREDSCDAVEISCRTYSMGVLLQGSGWAPEQERHVRLFRRGTVDLPAAVHAQTRALPGHRLAKVPATDGTMVHFNYVGWDQFIEKLNRYTRLEAEERLAAGKRPSGLLLTRELAEQIVYRGFRGRVWRDGWVGLLLLVHMLWYRIAVFTKHLQLTRRGTPDTVTDSYRAIGLKILEQGIRS